MGVQRMVNSSRKARLPDFIAVGPQRTGTTWLDRVLRGRVGLPRGVKETDFFSWRYAKGLKWYAWHFRDCRPELPIGEVCPSYFAVPQARMRIAQHIPNCKIIITLRDPVEWLYSYYRLQRRMGRTTATFEEALTKHYELMWSITRFAFTTAVWQDTFGHRNVLVLLLDDIRNAPQEALQRFCHFIAIAPIELDPSALIRHDSDAITHAPRSRRLAQNATHVMDWMRDHRMYRTINWLERVGFWRYCRERGEKYEPLDSAVEARVRELLRPEVYALECLLERDLSAWKSPAARRVAAAEVQDRSRAWEQPPGSGAGWAGPGA